LWSAKSRRLVSGDLFGTDDAVPGGFHGLVPEHHGGQPGGEPGKHVEQHARGRECDE
jgi:hypothetical protein